MPAPRPTVVRRAARAAARTATLLSFVGLILSTTDASFQGVPPAGAAPIAGTATIITPADGSADGNRPLAEGLGSTAFSLALPIGAACKGDSANDGYRVQGYMVPAAVDPSSLTFGASGPIPPSGATGLVEALYRTTGSPYVNAQTANATSPGGPGPVINIPGFDFRVFRPGEITPGAYNIGIACTKGPASPTQLDRFWSAQMEITADARDESVGIGWRAVPTDGGPTDGGTGGSTDGGTTGGSTDGGTGGSTDGGSTDGGTTDGGAGGSTDGGTPGGTAGGGTTGGGGVDVLGAGAGPSGTPIVGGLSTLPATGASVLSPVTWAVLLVVSGRMAVLLGRPPRVKPALR